MSEGGIEAIPDGQAIRKFHQNADTDTDPTAIHHTLGPGVNQAASGSHDHRGADSVVLGEGITITGSKGGNAALQSVISAMVEILGVTDSTT